MREKLPVHRLLTTSVLGIGVLVAGLSDGSAAPVSGAHSARVPSTRTARAHKRTPNEQNNLVITARKGDHLIAMLRRHQLATARNMPAILAAGRRPELARMQIGARIAVALDPNGSGTIRAIRLDNGDSTSAATIRSARAAEPARPDRAAAAPPRRPQAETVARVSGRTGRSLAEAMRRAKVPGPVAREVMTALRTDRKAPRRIAAGTHFTVAYEPARGAGQVARLRSVALEQRGRRWAYGTAPAAPGKKLVAVNDQRKDVIRVPVMMTQPLSHTKVTSPFGWRVHPVLGTWRFHDGVDFGAPQGTPVRAAADGVVVDVGRRGNYGDYIRIRHTGQLQTAYAHLAGYAPGLRPGSAVERGQLIGYVGRTGLATGCHLYYEVILNGHHLDPLKVESMPAQVAQNRAPVAVPHPLVVQASYRTSGQYAQN